MVDFLLNSGSTSAIDHLPEFSSRLASQLTTRAQGARDERRGLACRDDGQPAAALRCVRRGRRRVQAGRDVSGARHHAWPHAAAQLSASRCSHARQADGPRRRRALPSGLAGSIEIGGG
ncbi:hypothetical protein PAHAL_8G251900 [Panicum hallii]|uniref:Uncharacterized protein n=1 Tax=Panicum hallii TaxID=206008 RepID=A0A2S3IF95_9POAL|nr:hypothetical protein PAHAL_8G251900 [Panicum hallii]